MGWLHSFFSPLKRLWLRMHSAHKKSGGIYILYEDVKSCQYEDVHILWSILVESHPPALPLPPPPPPPPSASTRTRTRTRTTTK